MRRHFTAHFDRDNVAVRQMGISNTYNKLVEMAQVTNRKIKHKKRQAIDFSHVTSNVVSFILDSNVIVSRVDST